MVFNFRDILRPYKITSIYKPDSISYVLGHCLDQVLQVLICLLYQFDSYSHYIKNHFFIFEP